MDSSRPRRMTSKESKDKNLNLVDVYDIAADIGKEFEQLIDQHGAEEVTSLMQKVISALEHLEQLVHHNETEMQTIEDLRKTIEHLEHEETKKADERVKYARDIEQVEEHYKAETKDYLTTIKRLQEENRKLSSSLTAATERDSAFSDEESYIEIDLVNKLQGIVERQREQIRSLENNLNDVKSDLEEIKSQNEKLSGSNKDLRRKLRQSQSQLHCLVDERAELQVTLQDAQRETHILARRLGLAARENEELAQSACSEPRMTGKVVYDLDDPNRPRFTLTELKDILQERNSLKARVSDLEDELELYRPNSRCKTLNSTRLSAPSHHNDGSEVCDCAFHSGKEHLDELENLDLNHLDSDSEEDSSDRPVQGPMPYEPEDAPWKKSEVSGIRKFFKRVFGTSIPSADDNSMRENENPGDNTGYGQNVNVRAKDWVKKFSQVRLNLHFMSDVCEGFPEQCMNHL